MGIGDVDSAQWWLGSWQVVAEIHYGVKCKIASGPLIGLSKTFHNQLASKRLESLLLSFADQYILIKIPGDQMESRSGVVHNSQPFVFYKHTTCLERVSSPNFVVNIHSSCF